jgi:MFS family permease
MNFGKARLWMYSLVPQGVAMGLANLLILLFLVTTLKGNLFEVGVLAGVSAISLIPSVIFWGWLADKSARCKPYLVFSFLSTGIIILLIPGAQNVYQLYALAVAKSITYAASMPTRQILTIESESRQTWQSGVARLQFLEGIGETAGLGLGVVASPVLGFGALFTLCSSLSLASALSSALSIRDPGLMFERRLVFIERFANTLVTASTLVSHAGIFGNSLTPSNVTRLFRPTLAFFMLGIFSFSLGAAALYSPLPVYFLGSFSSSAVFLLFFANSAANTLGYLFVSRIAKRGEKTLLLSSALRILLIPVLAIQAFGASGGFILAALVLASMGCIWALFDVSSTCMFLELSRMGRAGLYGASTGLGSALGSFLGGFGAMGYGFRILFMVCVLIYATSLTTFALQFRRQKGFESSA